MATIYKLRPVIAYTLDGNLILEGSLTFPDPLKPGVTLTQWWPLNGVIPQPDPWTSDDQILLAVKTYLGCDEVVWDVPAAPVEAPAPAE